MVIMKNPLYKAIEGFYFTHTGFATDYAYI